jgi:hypothetical protein
MKTKFPNNMRMLILAIAAVLLIGPGMAQVAEKISIVHGAIPAGNAAALADNKVNANPGIIPAPASSIFPDHCVVCTMIPLCKPGFEFDSCSCTCRQEGTEPTVIPTPTPEYHGPCALFCPNGYNPDKYCVCLEKPKFFEW